MREDVAAPGDCDPVSSSDPTDIGFADAEKTLQELAQIYLRFKQPCAASEAPFAWQTDKARSEAIHRIVLEEVPAIVFMASLEDDGLCAYVNPQIEASLGFTQTEWLHDPIRFFRHIHPEDRLRWSTEVAQTLILGKPLKSIYRVLARDGRVVWFLCDAKMVNSNEARPWAIHGVAFDVTEMKEAETALLQVQRQLSFDAFHDGLTKLPNRLLFVDRLDRAIARAKRHGKFMFAVLFIDLDRFKIVNDSLGHQAGDDLIVQVSQRLLSSLRREDTVSRSELDANPAWTTKDDTLARLGGDEFTVLLDDLSMPSDSVRVAERILRSFEEPFHVRGHEIVISASIGVATNTLDSTGAEILRNADIAMYRAKMSGKSRFEVFDKTMHDEVAARLKLEADLRKALEREEFCLVYEPIVSLRTSRIVGFEALVRWQQPEVGLVGPAKFIAVMEETGLIVALGAWVLRKACEAARRWYVPNSPEDSPTVSVNVSARQFEQRDIVEQIQQILDQTGTDPRTIILEITETACMADVNRTIEVIRELKKLGVCFSIDDFGTGYSSLSYLGRLPIDALKVDRLFVHGLTTDPENQQIVNAINALARALAITVVAEGVETAEEFRRLQQLDCEFAQGYYFSRPLHELDASALLAGNKPTLTRLS